MKNIPVIAVSGKSLAEAYETALISLYEKGTRFKTQYDKPGDPLSIDCTLNLTIEEPETDPVIHMAFPGGIEDLKEKNLAGRFVPYIRERHSGRQRTPVRPGSRHAIRRAHNAV